MVFGFVLAVRISQSHFFGGVPTWEMVHERNRQDFCMENRPSHCVSNQHGQDIGYSLLALPSAEVAWGLRLRGIFMPKIFRFRRAQGLSSIWLMAAAYIAAATFSHAGLAASVTISGVPFAAFPGDGNSVNKNNVVDFDPSGIEDKTNGKSWIIQGSIVANLPNYAVDWYFNGAESKTQNIQFQSGGVFFIESNQNNNVTKGNDPGWKLLGTMNGSGAGHVIPFALTDLSTGGTATNGANHAPGAFIASMMFAYVTPQFEQEDKDGKDEKYGKDDDENKKSSKLIKWRISSKPTDWFAFGFAAAGSRNGDHDDYMGIGHVYATPTPTPLPGALPLMGSVLGGGCLVRWLRRRRSRIT